jgi:P4 family phage/plasmid primase-like protien
MIDNLIKIGCTLSNENGKKHITGLPKNWLQSTKSIYNNQDNWMIICGQVNNITVIDLDYPKNDEQSSIDWFEENVCKISDLNTFVTKTINGGYHIYYQYSNLLKTTTKLNNIPLDILNDQKGVLEGKGYNVFLNKPIRQLTDNEIYSLQKNIEINNEINNINNEINNELDNNLYTKDYINRILSGLDKSRFDNYDDWLRIGFFLCQYDFGKELFDTFSKQSSKYNKEEIDSRWDSFDKTKSKITISTILFWLKTDNPDLFEIIQKEPKILSEINEITKSNNIIAHEVIHIDRSNIDLICQYETALVPLHNVSSKKCKKCELQGLVNSNGFLLVCLNCDFTYPQIPIQITKSYPTIYNIVNQLNIYEDIKNKDTLQIALKLLPLLNLVYIEKYKEWYKFNSQSGIYETISELLILNLIDDTIVKLKQSGQIEDWFSWISKINYKEMLIRELKPKCCKQIELDNCSFTIGFPNGVYNLDTLSFDKGDLTDYVHNTCYYPFNPETQTTLAETLLRDYFPNDIDYQYVLDLLTLCLEGTNRFQQFTICYGFSASNGKSFLMDRLFSILGDYSNTFPVNMLTNKMREAGNANVDLIHFKNKRFMYFSEPEANSKFNTNLLKQMTGDTITARKNHSNDIEKIKPTYNLFICCNRLPELDNYDEGISRRINIIEFKNKFVDKPNKKNIYEKQRKIYSESEIINIDKSLMHLLIKNYKDLKCRNFTINVPSYIELLKKSYEESNNNIKDILDDYYKYSENHTDFIYKKDIKNVLKIHKLKINDIDLIRTVESLYGCQYYSDTHINNTRYKIIFKHLTTI